MKTRILVALFFVFGLTACADQITNVTYVNEGPTSVEVLSPNIQMGASQQYSTQVLTTIVGRTSANFPDSTIVSTSNSKIGTAKRINWGYYDGFDELTKQPFVVVYETYLIKTGETAGETTLTFTSATNPKISGKMNLTVCIGPACKG